MKHLLALSSLGVALCMVQGNAKAGDYHQILTERQFLEEIVGRPIIDGTTNRLFDPDGTVSSVLQLKRRAPDTSSGRKRKLPEPRVFDNYKDGKWTWDNAYLCIEWPASMIPTIGTGCQVVLVSGDQVLFVHDRGQGKHDKPFTFQ